MRRFFNLIGKITMEKDNIDTNLVSDEEIWRLSRCLRDFPGAVRMITENLVTIGTTFDDRLMVMRSVRDALIERMGTKDTL